VQANQVFFGIEQADLQVHEGKFVGLPAAVEELWVKNEKQKKIAEEAAQAKEEGGKSTTITTLTMEGEQSTAMEEEASLQPQSMSKSISSKYASSECVGSKSRSERVGPKSRSEHAKR